MLKIQFKSLLELCICLLHMFYYWTAQNLKSISTHLEFEEKVPGPGQQNDDDVFYSSVQKRVLQYLLSLMFQVALHRVSNQKIINPNA
jgi:hypothetical protein